MDGSDETNWSTNSAVIVVETEDLIAQVRRKRCLWDNKDKNYVKRDHQRLGWREVADALKAPVAELKKRWRGLRDTYSRELRKLDPPAGAVHPTNAELIQLSNWRYFPQLIFLRPVVGHNRSKRKAEETLDIDDSHSDHSSPDIDKISDGHGYISVSVKQEHEDPLPTPDPMAFRDEKARTQDTSANDADELFLKSLLPFLQEVPHHRKLLVRTQLLQVLMDEQHINQFDNH